MNELAYPFLSALLVPRLTDVALTDRHGNAVEVTVDTYQTPHHSFVLLSLPRSRRMLIRPRTVRVITP